MQGEIRFYGMQVKPVITNSFFCPLKLTSVINQQKIETPKKTAHKNIKTQLQDLQSALKSSMAGITIKICLICKLSNIPSSVFIKES